jgi:hypothetical protein
MSSAPARARSSGAGAGLAEGEIAHEQFMEIANWSSSKVSRFNL